MWQRPQIRQQVRITAQLIDATTGGHLWAERFDRNLTDIFSVQDDVTQQIVDALTINLTEGDQQRLAIEQTGNLEAYDCFLHGREQLWRFTRAQNIQGRKLLQRAIELDPNYAPAHAFLAFANILDYASGGARRGRLQWNKRQYLRHGQWRSTSDILTHIGPLA